MMEYFHVFAYTALSIFIIIMLFIVKFWKDSVKESVNDLATMKEILERHKEVDGRDERLAMLLGMTQAQLRVELQQHDRLDLIARKTEIIATRLKSTFPINYGKR